MDTCVSFWETLLTSDGYPMAILYFAVAAFHQAISTFEKTYVSACCMMESNRSNSFNEERGGIDVCELA